MQEGVSRRTESRADKQLGDALRVVVLLVFKDVAGRHLLLHLLGDGDGK